MDNASTSPCCAPRRVEALPAHEARPGPVLEPVVASRARSTRGQVLVPGGSFEMGDTFDEGYRSDGETPVHEVRLEPFFMDATTVTNAAFAAFVKDSGYVTEAEELGVSAVFHLAFGGSRADVLHEVAEAPWWWAVRGASWRHPGGPATSNQDRPNHPVVHVTWRDAGTYAAWAGKRLPTEAEWEYAARGGLARRRFAWGDELTPRGRWQCNIWQGDFPRVNTRDDGHLTTAPVKSFRPNDHGLWQMAGNVWEWCADWFSPDYYATSPVQDPRGPETGAARVTRGGSYLCHDSYCHRYRVAARSSNTPDSASGNTGFRCANDAS